MPSIKVLEAKKETVSGLKEKIEKASILVLSQYSGFTVKEISELRKKLRAQDSEFSVVKNTLLKRAMEAAGYSSLGEYFSGPTAILIGYKDPVSPVKTLVDFIKEVEKGEVRAGIIEKSVVLKEKIIEISKLPPREILIAKVVGGFKSPMFGLVFVLSGTLKKLLYALNAIKEKKGGETK